MALASYKQQIGSSVAMSLAPLRFRKKGLSFIRKLPELVHIVSLQSSISSTDSRLKITMNLAIWVPSLAREGSKPDVSSAQWRERVGFLMPEQTDHWWEISSDDDAVLVSKQIVEALVTWGLPQLEQLSTKDALAKLWRLGHSPGLTALQAKQYLNKIANEEVA